METKTRKKGTPVPILTFKMEIWEKSFSSKYACVMSCSFAWRRP